MVRPAPFLGPRDPFPDPSRTGPEGLVALSRSLQPAQILRAYHQGIFP